MSDRSFHSNLPLDSQMFSYSVNGLKDIRLEYAKR